MLSDLVGSAESVLFIQLQTVTPIKSKLNCGENGVLVVFGYPKLQNTQ